jgi:hypothetical protein
MGTHQEGIAIGFVIVEMLLAKCDECEARGGGLYGLFDAEVDDRMIIIRTSRKRAQKAATARISAGAARDCSSRDRARLVSTTVRHRLNRRAVKAPIASAIDLLSETHWPSTTPSSIAMPPPMAM